MVGQTLSLSQTVMLAGWEVADDNLSLQLGQKSKLSLETK